MFAVKGTDPHETQKHFVSTQFLLFAKSTHNSPRVKSQFYLFFLILNVKCQINSYKLLGDAERGHSIGISPFFSIKLLYLVNFI